MFGREYEIISELSVKSLFEKRDRDANKGNYGYVGIMGGCPSYSGAVKLANMSQAALRSGCGVSRLIVPESISGSVAPYLLESTLYEMPCDRDGYMMACENKTVTDCIGDEDIQSSDGTGGKRGCGEAFNKLKSLAVGMGWGQSDNYVEILKYILTKLSVNLIIDADGLNMLSKGNINLLNDTDCRVVLTPHLMEFSRLSGYSISEIKENRVALAREFAAEYNVVLLLKGADTVVTDGENVLICDRGTPGMATAGSGDVLSGILAGMSGYIPVSVKSVAAGAYINGVAGEYAAQEYGEVSMTAGDTVSMIPRVLKDILK